MKFKIKKRKKIENIKKIIKKDYSAVPKNTLKLIEEAEKLKIKLIQQFGLLYHTFY